VREVGCIRVTKHNSGATERDRTWGSSSSEVAVTISIVSLTYLRHVFLQLHQGDSATPVCGEDV
jgi:hypothetical protein